MGERRGLVVNKWSWFRVLQKLKLQINKAALSITIDYTKLFVFRMSCKTLLFVCLLYAAVNVSSLFEIDDDGIINDVIAEANKEIENKIQMGRSKHGFDLSSIPGHEAFMNSDG